jgi:hypothetical protein
MRGLGTYALVKDGQGKITDHSSIVLSVFAIVILSVIGALFKVRHLRSSTPRNMERDMEGGGRETLCKTEANAGPHSQTAT